MSQRLLILTLVLLLGWTPAASLRAQALNLPDMGDPSEAYFGSDEERRMGLEMMRQLRQRDMILDDVQLTAYLNSIGQSIVTYADQNGAPFNFFAVRSAAINAFALPHNFIGINAGLLLATEREDELAGVIAHEIAHVSQKHIVRAIADMKRMAVPLAAAMVASAALAAASKEAGQAAMVGSMAAGAQHQINFTRANEQEADRIGMRLLAKAGFDPSGMSDFFTKLERRAGGSNDQIPEMLLTHPRPERRAADTQDRLEAPPPPRRAAPRDRKAYELAKARARVLAANDVRALLRELETRLTKGDFSSEAAARYARALALRQTGRYDEARQQIADLLRSDPDRLAFRIEAAEIALARGATDQAWRAFEEARQLYPDDFVLAMHYGRALATQGDPQRALRVLQPHLSRHPNDSLLYAAYAQAAQRGGDMPATHATMAEYHYLNGELLPAIEQLELGLRSAGLSPNRQAQLRARLKQLRAEAIAQNLPVSKRDSP
ncbi:MAG: M48 family metallopeptidase [Candidatus Competibacteraceae bacterium]|nr:M48 family metallopeptidase [Candidatus Competibacteraceae bacterium]